MNIRQILLTGTTVMLLATGNVWARGNSQEGNSQGGNSQWGHSQGSNSQGGNSQGSKSQGGYLVPEIDAASGATAIALLTGILLLVGERSRSRRS